MGDHAWQSLLPLLSQQLTRAPPTHPRPHPNSQGAGSPVALNNASAAFYYLCPAHLGYCADGACVFGRTRAAPKGAWATCEPLAGCGAADALSGCFPAAATVRLPGGATKRMDELVVGDRVLAAAEDGSLAFQDVYFFGHRAADADAAFVRLELAGAAALELTPDHFVPVVAAAELSTSAGARLAGAKMTYARDVRVGDVLLVTSREGGEGALLPAAVAGVTYVRRAGLFNPYTLGGTIVVDCVLASAHSGWLVDGAAAALGVSHHLPAAFQAAFAPLRALYAAAGPEFMQRFGDALAGGALRLEAALLAPRRHAPAEAAGAAAPAAMLAAAGVAAAAVSRRRRRGAAAACA